MGWGEVKANVVTELRGWLESCQAERLQRRCWSRVGDGRGSWWEDWPAHSSGPEPMTGGSPQDQGNPSNDPPHLL